MEEKVEATAGHPKNSIEALNKEELLQKYKGLLGIAKKAKQAKDELAEENRRLKEALARSETQKDADKKALLTMKEMLEEFTEQKLQLTTQLSEQQKKGKSDEEFLSQLRIENESLKRQMDRLNDDNESLLKDIDRMEDQLKQVNLLGMEQKQNLGLLELEVNKLKEAESLNSALQITITASQEENKTLKEQENKIQQAMEELTHKYSRIKDINTEQRHKFNTLKDRFVEVHRKLRNLKECKVVLLETQHEYAEAVSRWQKEIIKASNMLCAEMNKLKGENEELAKKLQLRDEVDNPQSEKLPPLYVESVSKRLEEMYALSDIIREEMLEKESRLAAAELENEQLKEELIAITNDGASIEMSTEVPQLQLEIKRLTQELTDLKVTLQDCETKLQMSYKEKDDLETDYIELKHCVNSMKAERYALNEQSCIIQELNSEKQHLKQEINQLVEKLSEAKNVHQDLQQIRDVLKALEEEKVSLLAQLKQQEAEQLQQQNVENNGSELEINYDELKVRYAQKEREHADLLSEMRELNEALKARGDMISRQQEKQQELVNELRKTNLKLKQTDDEVKQKDQLLIQKDERAREITQEIEDTQQKVHQLKDACSKSEEQMRVLNEELQSLRNNADCQSEVMSTSTISRADEAARLREVDENYEDKYNKLRTLAMKLKKKLQDQTVYVTEMEQQQSGHTALKHEAEDGRKQLAALKEAQEENQKLIDTLRAENSKLKSSRKQANVLNLEIEAAEKSLSEATSKLAAKSSELEAMNEVLASKEHTIVQLRKEIAIVESAKTAECTHAKELKEQVDRLQVKLKDALHEKQEAQMAKKDLEQSQERLKLELEELRLEVAKCASKTEAVLSASQREKEHIKHKLIETKAQLSDSQNKLVNVERTLEDLQIEHLEYKVKAQAVLRKNQSKDTTRERELEDELAKLRAAEQQAQINAALQAEKLAESQKLAEQLRIDNDSTQRRSRELMAIVDELRQQNDILAQENREQMQAQQEAVQQIHTTNTCHTQQLQDLEAKYQRQMEQLRAEHERAIRVPPTIGANAAVANASGNNMSHSDQSKIEFLLMEREDAEGSEAEAAANNHAALRKISTSSRRSQHDFMPLDELLNLPMHTFSDTVTTISGNSLGRNDHSTDANANGNLEALHVELHATKELLQKQESRVRHLTALLAENEQDLAKLTQMNDMLKEELRRQERSVEREQHMHNSEYMKNVILKFLTLNSGDERVRLVPVLNTILKLSRNESDVLNCVAKGQKLPGESHGRSWSFLPIWNSSGNGNN